MWSVMAAALATVLMGGERESITAHGILPGSTMVLFAEVRSCRPTQAPPFAQLFVSTDEGKTWVKRGPAVEGSEFQYAANSSEGVWVAGLHTMEGPGIDPFVLVPGGDPAGSPEWTLSRIYQGPAELQSVLRAKPGELSASIKHIDVGSQRWQGQIHLHQSHDGGLTWTAVGPAKGSVATRGKFAKLSKDGPIWRIADRKDRGFDVQRRTGQLWHTVSAFPWQACP
jgi:hypothetical protein